MEGVHQLHQRWFDKSLWSPQMGRSLVQEWSDDSARSQHSAWKYPDGRPSDSDRKSIGHKTSDKSKYAFILYVNFESHTYSYILIQSQSATQNLRKPYHRFVIDVSCFARLYRLLEQHWFWYWSVWQKIAYVCRDIRLDMRHRAAPCVGSDFLRQDFSCQAARQSVDFVVARTLWCWRTLAMGFRWRRRNPFSMSTGPGWKCLQTGRIWRIHPPWRKCLVRKPASRCLGGEG